MTGWDEMPLDERITQERTAAAQMEWERWRRVVGTVTVGMRQTAVEIEQLTKGLDVDASTERELLRHAANIRASADELDGDNWLKSPQAMAALRAEAAQ